MNKLSRHLVSVSLVLLGLAICGGLWLVWQTISESRALERQNRELQASLEASRIRVENFCEYPSDVLCRVDERSGTVAGALPESLPGLDELAGTSSQKAEPAPAASSSASPAKALENVKKVAQVQSELAMTQDKKSVVAQESKVLEAVKLAPSKDSPAAPTQEKDATKPAASKASPVAPTLEKDKAVKAVTTDIKPAEKEAPKAAKPEEKSAVSAETVYTQEISGKLTDYTISSPAPSPSKKPDATSLKKQNVVRQSWTRVDQDGDIFVFTMTGAGDQMKARGSLLSSPLRYELVIDGHFNVRSHKDISNRLVKSIDTHIMKGKTIIVFKLKAKPYKCSLHERDDRTVSLRIR